MGNDRKALCFIPARSGSKRLPRKNIVPLKGKPLIAWTIECALESGIFDKAYVSSEDNEILRVAEKWGGTPMKRSPDLAGDTVTLLQLCLRETAKLVEDNDYADLYLLLPTSPFRKASTIREAWARFVNTDADALMSVIPCDHPPQWTLCIRDSRLAALYPEDYERPRQDLPKAYRHDGSHLITRLSKLFELRTFTGPKTIPFPVSNVEGVDINEPFDLTWAEFLLAKGMVN